MLVTQIQNGAPADVFASADQKNMQKLQSEGDVTTTPTVFAKNQMEIAVAPGNPKHITTVADLAKPGLIVVLCASEAPVRQVRRPAAGAGQRDRHAEVAGSTGDLAASNGATSDGATGDSARGGGATSIAQPVSLQTAEQTFDREIAAMRKVVDERRKELDPATVVGAREESEAHRRRDCREQGRAREDPASAFLLDRLTHAYDTKLQLLRGVASIPARG